MKSLFLGFLLVFLLTVSAVSRAVVFTIAPDQSRSSLLYNANYANAAAVYIREQIIKLKPGDSVHIQLLGRSDVKNFRIEKMPITRRQSAVTVSELPSIPSWERMRTTLQKWSRSSRTEASFIATLAAGSCHAGGVAQTQILNSI